MTKIEINKKECIGCCFCSDCAPSVFEIDRQGLKCEVKKRDLSEEEIIKVREAEENCPVGAIKILE